MGELADRMQRFATHSRPDSPTAGDWDEWHRERWAIKDAIAELELRADMLEAADSIAATLTRDPDTGFRVYRGDVLPASILRDLLADAERRAEQAERIAAVAQLPEMLGRRAVLSYSPLDEVTRAGYRFVADHRDDGLRVEVENYGKRDRRLSVCVFESDSDTPDPTLLERRGTDLIEAGEKLLAEYELQRKGEKVPA